MMNTPMPRSAADLARMLSMSPAFQNLPLDRQQEMHQQASKIFGYLEQNPSHGYFANPFADPPAAQPAGDTQKQGDVIRRAGSAAKHALDSIDFPSFVASLVQGTFQAIVDSSIQQMEAYSQLLASVAKTVDQFMDEHITDDMAKDYLADNHADLFGREVTSNGPKLTIQPPPPPQPGQRTPPPLPGFLQDLGFTDAGDLDEQAVNETVIPNVRRTLAETRHQSLATMVMMGINRIVVDEGEINAKLIFTVDASETTAVTFDDSKTTNWGMSGTLGRNPFGASGIVVTTTNVNTQSDINLRAELTGEVRIKFKSDYFPLERFADSAAIQLINNSARPMPLQKAVEAANANTDNGEGAAQQEHPDSPATQSLSAPGSWSVKSSEEPS